MQGYSLNYTTSVPKYHIQISPDCTPPMMSRYQAAYTGAQKSQISLKSLFLSLSRPPQISALQGDTYGHLWPMYYVCSSCTLPAALRCWVGQYVSPYGRLYSSQRAAGRAIMRAFMVIYGSFCNFGRPLRAVLWCKLIDCSSTARGAGRASMV